MNIFSNKIQGFTLLETIVSTAILAFVIIGPLATIINSSSYARKTKDSMTSTYLAEEAIELLQNQYDSLYIYCRKQPDQCPLLTGETLADASWRMFKERMVATTTPLGAQPSCYKNDNPNGCSFDTFTMTGDVTAVPSRYDATSPSCKTLVEVSVPVVITAGPSNGTTNNPGETTINRHTYVCSGLSNRVPYNATTSTKFYSRSVSLEHLSTAFESSQPMNRQYHDDVKVISKVTFSTSGNGSSTVILQRFMHERQ